MKTLLTLAAFDYVDGKVKLRSDSSFTVMLNPAEFTHHCSIKYCGQPTQGGIGSESKFDLIEPEKVSFKLTLDGTGVVPQAAPGTKYKSVIEQVRDLNVLIYGYVGTKHEPNHVRILWGTLIFFGRLESLSTEYTLFKPSGDPLRARLTLSFVGTMSKEEQTLVANTSSPDLSHIVEVRQGDTLPLLCQRIYGDSSYYPEVARVNNLVDFRNLEPGGRLHFPPLE